MGKGIARKQRFGIMIQKREHPLLVGDLLVVVRPERRDLITQCQTGVLLNNTYYIAADRYFATFCARA